MPVITALQQQAQNSQRINVFLDGAYAFAVHVDLAVALHAGQVLTEQEIAALQTQAEHEQAYQAALRFLGPRPRSQAEVERQLRTKGFSAASVEAAIARLAAHQYLNDREFARFWADNRARFRPRSAAALEYELRQRGVAKETIAATLADLDETEAAWAAIAPKLARWAQLEPMARSSKVSAFLARRGFDFEVIRAINRRAWQQGQDEDSA